MSCDKLFKIKNYTICEDKKFIQEKTLKLGEQVAERKKHTLEVFYKKGCSRISAKFTGKYLCQSLFFNKVADRGLRNLRSF